MGVMTGIGGETEIAGGHLIAIPGPIRTYATDIAPSIRRW